MNRIRDRRWDGKSRWEPCHVLSPLPVSADDEISAEPRKVADNEITPDRRHSLRQKVNTPAFASFDGVTGGVILDLSEEGLAMHTAVPLEPPSPPFASPQPGRSYPTRYHWLRRLGRCPGPCRSALLRSSGRSTPAPEGLAHAERQQPYPS